MKEFDLIRVLAARTKPMEGLQQGIGDDAAVLEPGRFDLVTVDTMVEGVHFRRAWSTPRDIGWKLIAVNLSDIAAMGGAPGPYFLALSVGDSLCEADILALIDGMQEATAALVPEGFETGLAGGDTTRSPGPSVLTLTLLGESPPTGAIRRSGARPGDRIVLIGDLGWAAAGLALLDSDLPPEAWPSGAQHLVAAHRRPRAQVLQGALLGLHGLASALIDVSDGCVHDLRHLLEGSHVGARLNAAHIPVPDALRATSRALGVPIWDWVLAGGDDYALLATVSPERMGQLWQLAREYDFTISDIGEVGTEEEGLELLDDEGNPMALEFEGYEHTLGLKEKPT